MFKPVVVFVLLTFTASNVFACTPDEAAKTVSNFYSVVKYFSGIPAAKEVEDLSPFISLGLASQLRAASLLDERHSRQERQAGETFWGSETKIFLSEEDGFSYFKVLSVGNQQKEIPVQLTIALPNETPFYWIDTAIVVTEAGRCVVNDVRLKDKSMATDKLKRAIDEIR